jgi:hypothetical protein
MNKYLALSIALIAATPALAQDTAVVFAALDVNKDGQVSQAEAQKNMLVAQNFAQADTNKDGMLSKAEFDAAFGKK